VARVADRHRRHADLLRLGDRQPHRHSAAHLAERRVAVHDRPGRALAHDLRLPVWPVAAGQQLAQVAGEKFRAVRMHAHHVGEHERFGDRVRRLGGQPGPDAGRPHEGREFGDRDRADGSGFRGHRAASLTV
jgi:hypothetical protein